MSALRFVCLATLLVALKCQKIPVKQTEGEDSSRIVNGSRARPGQFPFVISLQLNYFSVLRSHVCTLSLITKKTSLGAAHCAVQEDGTKMDVNKLCGIVGSIIQSQDTACHKYSDTVVHDQYDSDNVINDIAVFIFEEEIELDGKSVDTIPVISGIKFRSKTITAIGWGNLHTLTEQDSPKILRFVNLRLLPAEECSVADKQLCIDTEGKGVCAGDSGGPNIISVAGKQIQVGISSYVQNECADSISVAVAIGAYTEWIKKNSVGEPTFVGEKGLPT